MPALAISPQDQATVLVAVSQKYQIPLGALLGIYGQETGFGSNVSTSSANAVGPFQFIPSTAVQYGYPQTNTPNLQQFTQQADAWGRYLVANNPSRDPNGWAPAMRGGYTEAQAASNLAHIPNALKTALVAVVGTNYLNDGKPVPGTTITPGPGTIGSITNPLSSVADAIGAVFTFLTTPANWLRILEFIAGAILVFKALMQLSGADNKVTQIVTTAARTVK